MLDKVISTKPEFEKIWLLHSINKPEIKDNLITIKNGDGKLWCYVIKPDDFDIRLVGGKGREFEVNGVNYPLDSNSPHVDKKRVESWAGAWRVELIEKKPDKLTYFMNVLIPTDKESKHPPMVKEIKNGVRIEDWQIVYENDDLKVTKIENYE